MASQDFVCIMNPTFRPMIYKAQFQNHKFIKNSNAISYPIVSMCLEGFSPAKGALAQGRLSYQVQVGFSLFLIRVLPSSKQEISFSLPIPFFNADSTFFMGNYLPFSTIFLICPFLYFMSFNLYIPLYHLFDQHFPMVSSPYPSLGLMLQQTLM